MPNDDLGTFPMPPQATPSPAEPTAPLDQPLSPSQPEPTEPIPPINTFPETPSVPPTDQPFEETPDEIPSIPLAPASLDTEHEKLVQANEELIEKQTSLDTAPQQPLPEPPSSPTPAPDQEAVPATIPPKTGNSLTSIIIIILLIVAGIGLTLSVYLSAQTGKLKTQLEEITQTLEKQQTTLTPTATPTVFEIPTPTIPLETTPSATPTVALNSLTPLKNAPSALQIAINHSPNAQLILIKVDNATSADTAVTKYFFRESLATKKYFYVAVTGKDIPEVIDKQIYVTPDDNIPSLNDSVLENKLGIDLDEAIRIAYTQCVNEKACFSAAVKAQYIKTGSGIIWQLSIYANGASATPLMIQLDAQTKAILYKSPEFANK